MKDVAIVSPSHWGTKVHLAINEMTVKPGTFRSVCGKSWQVRIGLEFSAVPESSRCARCAASVAQEPPSQAA